MCEAATGNALSLTVNMKQPYPSIDGFSERHTLQRRIDKPGKSLSLLFSHLLILGLTSTAEKSVSTTPASASTTYKQMSVLNSLCLAHPFYTNSIHFFFCTRIHLPRFTTIQLRQRRRDSTMWDIVWVSAIGALPSLLRMLRWITETIQHRPPLSRKVKARSSDCGVSHLMGELWPRKDGRLSWPG